jgi:hypothetical protein
MRELCVESASSSSMNVSSLAKANYPKRSAGDQTPRGSSGHDSRGDRAVAVRSPRPSTVRRAPDGGARGRRPPPHAAKPSAVPIAPVDAPTEREAAAFAARADRPGPATLAAADTGPGALPGSHGVPLERGLRNEFECALGAELGGVRIHDDPSAHSFARAAGARAATLGGRIYFGRGLYVPDTAAGHRLLAHELVHTLQPEARTVLHRTPESEQRLHDIEALLDTFVISEEERARLEQERAQLLQEGQTPAAGVAEPTPPASQQASPAQASTMPAAPTDTNATGADVVAAGMLTPRMPGLPLEPVPPAMPPAPSPMGFPRIPGETPLNFTPSAGGAVDGVAAGEGAAAEAGLAGGSAETVTVGGTMLGEGTLVSGGGALAEGATAAGSSLLAEGTAVIGGTTLAEGTAVVGATVVAGGAEVAAVTGATVASAGVGAAAGAAAASSVVPVVGWIVAAVIVGSIAVYLITREEPREAPGAPGGAPVSEPAVKPAAIAPGAPGQAPAVEPESAPPALAPGAPSSGPLQASGPLDGAREHEVFDANGDLITDIDHIEGDTLWEEKTAVNAADIPDFVSKAITEKFDAYLRARARLPAFYANAAIGFRFIYKMKLELATAVWDEIERLRAANPDVTILFVQP